jgi:hypothetical protein
MNSLPDIETPPPRTWRDISQPITPRAMSREGRRRRVLAVVRVTGVVAAVLGLGWGGAEFFSTWRANPGALVAPAGGAAVRVVSVRSDGVLGEEWTRATLALAPQARLMALDLTALRTRLLVGGQVREAELTRQSPDRLLITLHERAPVARVLAREAGEAAPHTLLVARDGTVFVGAGHTSEAVARLPFLDGLRLVRAGAGFVPIEGMDRVADLLDAARVVGAGKNFGTVSLARLADDMIAVRADDGGEIVFDARGSFSRQLTQLGLVQAAARRQFPAEPLLVNLALGKGQVLVARQTVALSPGAPAGGGLTLPSLLPASSSRPSSTPTLFLPPPPNSPASHAL